MIDKLITLLISWLTRHHHAFTLREITNVDTGTTSAYRYYPLWLEELDREDMTAPWWYWFNVLVHQWVGGDTGWHDHPRWSITIVLRGTLVEHLPKRTRHLKAGSIVFRGHNAIHKAEPLEAGKTWTIFIVGRRNKPQNSYDVTPNISPWSDE